MDKVTHIGAAARKVAEAAGEVEGLERGADVRRAVAEVGDGHGVGAGVPVRPGGAGGKRHTAAHDRVGADSPGLEPLQVHAPAAAVAEPTVETADLAQRTQQRVADVVRQGRRGIDALRVEMRQDLGQELVVPAMRPVDRVVRGERDRRADGAALLADARVRRAVDEALAGEFEDELLERPDQHELAQDRGEQGRLGGVPVGLGDDELDPIDMGSQRLAPSHVALSKK